MKGKFIRNIASEWINTDHVVKFYISEHFEDNFIMAELVNGNEEIINTFPTIEEAFEQLEEILDNISKMGVQK